MFVTNLVLIFNLNSIYHQYRKSKEETTRKIKKETFITNNEKYHYNLSFFSHMKIVDQV